MKKLRTIKTVCGSELTELALEEHLPTCKPCDLFGATIRRLMALKGARSRSASMSRNTRTKIASDAARARWANAPRRK